MWVNAAAALAVAAAVLAIPAPAAAIAAVDSGRELASLQEQPDRQERWGIKSAWHGKLHACNYAQRGCPLCVFFSGASSLSSLSSLEAVPILKRLLREVFADLVAIRQKIEDLTPKEEEEDTLFVPYEGAATKPYPKAFAEGLRYRSKAQLSGAFECCVHLPLEVGLTASRMECTSCTPPWLNARGLAVHVHARVCVHACGAILGPSTTDRMGCMHGSDSAIARAGGTLACLLHGCLPAWFVYRIRAAEAACQAAHLARRPGLAFRCCSSRCGARTERAASMRTSHPHPYPWSMARLCWRAQAG